MTAPKFAMPKAILFDLDGTLVDTAPDLAYCVDQTFLHLGLEQPGEERVRLWVGKGVENLVQQALAWAGREGDPSFHERTLTLFSECYDQHYRRSSQLYPKVESTLVWLKEKAIPLACVTNKGERFTFPLLEFLGISRYFQSVVGGDTLSRRKPDPAPLHFAMRQIGLADHTNVMLVGDSVNDVKAARAAQCSAVCVNYGYNHGEPIELAEPDAVISDFSELIGLIKFS